MKFFWFSFRLSQRQNSFPQVYLLPPHQWLLELLVPIGLGTGTMVDCKGTQLIVVQDFVMLDFYRLTKIYRPMLLDCKLWSSDSLQKTRSKMPLFGGDGFTLKR